MANEDFVRICSAACERRGWVWDGKQVEVKFDDGRRQIVGLEYFEFDDIDTALARFDELIADTGS